MNVVTVDEAKRNLDSLIAKVFSNAEPTVITSETGQHIVMLSLDEFNGWQETAYLLSNPAMQPIFASLLQRQSVRLAQVE